MHGRGAGVGAGSRVGAPGGAFRERYAGLHRDKQPCLERGEEQAGAVADVYSTDGDSSNERRVSNYHSSGLESP